MKTEFTQEEIDKFPRMEMSINRFIQHAGRFVERAEDTLRPQLEELPHGAYLGLWQRDDGAMYALYLKKIWFKPYSLRSGVTFKQSDEVLVSNFPLPKGPVVPKTGGALSTARGGKPF